MSAQNSERVPLQGSFFSGVTARIFPLLADPSTLQNFIDRFLNYDDERGENYFRSANSYVYLQVLNYTNMAPRLEELGYLSQNEVLFSIPLLWYKKNPQGQSMYNGHRYELTKFVDVATSPYIFVDDRTSLLGGRELYGWPKQLMKINSGSKQWLEHPENDETLFSISVSLFEQLYRTKKRSSLPLLDIRRKNLHSRHQAHAERLVQLSDQPRNQLMKWNEIEQHRQSHEVYWYKEITRQAGPLEPQIGKQRYDLTRAELTAHELWQTSPLMGRTTSNIGLRQLPFSDRPYDNCYQSLNNSTSRVEQLRSTGSLGNLQNDLTGGIEIHLKQYEQLNIADSLGLIPSTRTDSSLIFAP